MTTVPELHAGLDALDAERAEALAGQAAARQDAADARAEREAATLELASARDQLAVAKREIDRLQAIIDGGTDPDPDPEPTRGVLYGGCPTLPNGTAAQVVAKYGRGKAAVRTFSQQGAGMNAEQRPDGAAIWHHSWKPGLTTKLTDAMIVNALTHAQAGDIFTVWHEPDVKARNGSLTPTQIAQAVALMNDFHDRVVRLRTAKTIPAVETCVVLAAWSWAPTSGLYPGKDDDPETAAFWGKVRADLAGVDLDAYGNLTKYPDFLPVIANVLRFVDQYDFAGWTVPEFIHPRIATDKTGAQRAAWITTTCTAMENAAPPPRAVMLFDTEWEARTGQVLLPGSPELAAIHALQA